MFGDNLENHFSACDVTCVCVEDVNLKCFGL